MAGHLGGEQTLAALPTIWTLGRLAICWLGTITQHLAKLCCTIKIPTKGGRGNIHTEKGLAL